MAKNAKISDVVIRRLPRYKRYLEELQRQGVDKVSSNELSRMIGYTASQIRQDLNNFGGFGQQGYGYNVDALHEKIDQILGLTREYKMGIAGAGNLGQAIANYTSYYKNGFVVDSIFEVNPRLIGLKINDIEVIDFDKLAQTVSDHGIELGIICVTKESAQDVADQFIKGGVHGIWNFAPVDLKVPDSVAIENVHLSDSLHSLVYYISQEEKAEAES